MYFYEKITQALHKQLASASDISQYFSLMKKASTGKTTIGFYEEGGGNFVLSDNKHFNDEALAVKEVINYSTSNYLSLGQHSYVLENVSEALFKYGTGANGSPILSGYFDLHHKLERNLSLVHRQDDTVLISSGFNANLVAIATLFSQETTLFIEENSHGSIFYAAKICGAKVRLFSNYNLSKLEQLIQKDNNKVQVIIGCGVFSMSGEIINLPGLVSISQKYNTLLMIDDAHAFGIIGKRAYGTADYYGIDSKNIDIYVGTLSKALSSQGGYICARKEVVDYIRANALPYILSASLSPLAVSAALASLQIIINEGEKLSKELIRKQKLFTESLRKLNIETHGCTAVVVVPIGDEKKTINVSNYLRKENIYVSAIIAPGVRKGNERLRFNITLSHTDKDLEYTAEKVKEGLHYV